MMTDLMADMLIRIENAVSTRRKVVEVPASSIKESITQILLDEGFVDGFSVTEDGKRGIITMDSEYGPSKGKAILGIKRASKPGLRVYARTSEVPKVLGGLGTTIVSTSKGLVTDKVARKEDIGGEVIRYVW